MNDSSKEHPQDGCSVSRSLCASEEVMFARSLKAAATAAGSPVSRRVVLRESEDRDRLAKIERLRQQVASGEYAANAADVSKRLIEDHLAN